MNRKNNNNKFKQMLFYQIWNKKNYKQKKIIITQTNN